MVDPSTLEKLRPCGRLETFSTARHHLNFYNNVGLTATYINPSSRIQLKNLVFGALHHVISEHSVLSAILLDEDKSFPEPYYARVPEINLLTCVQFIERNVDALKAKNKDDELDQILSEQHNRDFQEDLGARPFWKLVILFEKEKTDEFTASWIFHHALADGTSACLFHEAFLRALQAISFSSDALTEVNPIVKSPSTPILPALEDLHPLPLSWPYFIKAILTSVLPKWFDPRPANLFTGRPITAPISSRFRSLTLTVPTTKKLAQLSRRERTSVTATLQCIIAHSVFECLDEREGKGKYDTVRVDGPISMKRFLLSHGSNIERKNEIERSMLNGVTQYGYLHSRSSKSSSSMDWDEARSVKTEIQREIAKEGKDSVVALLKYVPDIRKFFTNQLGQERKSTFEMSNIGVYQPWHVSPKEIGMKKDDEGWRIGKMVFSQCPNVTGAAFAVSVVTGGDGYAVLGFEWLKGIVEDEFMAILIACVEKRVEKLVNAT